MTTSISAKCAGLTVARHMRSRGPLAQPARHRTTARVIEAPTAATDPGAPRTGQRSSSVQLGEALTQTVRLGAHPVRVAVAGRQLWFFFADLRDALGSEGIDGVIERLPARQRSVGITPSGERIQFVSPGGIFILAFTSDGKLGQDLRRWLRQRGCSRQPVDPAGESPPDSPWADFTAQLTTLEKTVATPHITQPQRTRSISEKGHHSGQRTERQEP